MSLAPTSKHIYLMMCVIMIGVLVAIKQQERCDGGVMITYGGVIIFVL